MRHGSTPALALVLALTSTLSPALALAGSWSLPDESQGHRIAPLLLLSRPDIRADLQLKPEQVVEAEKAVADLHARASALRGKTGAAAVAERKLVDESQKAWLERVLTEPQCDRLSQLDLRWEGPAAMATRPGVAESLALTAEQKASLAKAILDRNAERTRNAAEADHRFALKALSVLDDVQKNDWEKMLGRPFTPRPMTASADAQQPPAR